MFAKPTIFVLVAMFAAVLLSPAVAAHHIETPADRCTGLYEANCSYCSQNGGFQDQSDFRCNNHYSGYTWQDCQNYVYDYCIQGALLQQKA